MSRPGRRSKLSICASWFSEPLTRLKQVQTRPKHSTVRRRYCMSVNAILSTGQGQGQVSKGHLHVARVSVRNLNTLSFAMVTQNMSYTFPTKHFRFLLAKQYLRSYMNQIVAWLCCAQMDTIGAQLTPVSYLPADDYPAFDSGLSAEYPLAGVDV